MGKSISVLSTCIDTLRRAALKREKQYAYLKTYLFCLAKINMRMNYPMKHQQKKSLLFERKPLL